MATKTYVLTPAAMATLNYRALEWLFEDEPDFIFAFSPETLRHVCEQSAKCTYFLYEQLSARLANTVGQDDGLYDRPGFVSPLIDTAWLGKMTKLIRGHLADDLFNFDPSEIGYAQAKVEFDRRHAERAAISKVKEDAARASLAAKSKKQIDEQEGGPIDSASGKRTAAVAGPDTPKDEKNPAKSKPVFMNAKFFAKQLNISNLITGSRILTIGTQKRKSWTSNAPLVVKSISGIRNGTTTVEYNGEELRPADVETHAAALRLGINARDEAGAPMPLGSDIVISERSLLKALRRRDGGAAYIALREQISRLQNAKLIITTTYSRLIFAIAAAMPEDKAAQDAIKSGTLRIVVSLLGDSTSSTAETKPGLVSLTIPTRVRALFGKGLSSWFSEEDYYLLGTQTARRLFLLYARHANPRPFTLDELREWLGTEAKDNDSLRRTINAANREIFDAGLIVATPKYVAHPLRDGLKGYEIELACGASAEGGAP